MLNADRRSMISEINEECSIRFLESRIGEWCGFRRIESWLMAGITE